MSGADLQQVEEIDGDESTHSTGIRKNFLSMIKLETDLILSAKESSANTIRKFRGIDPSQISNGFIEESIVLINLFLHNYGEHETISGKFIAPFKSTEGFNRSKTVRLTNTLLYILEKTGYINIITEGNTNKRTTFSLTKPGKKELIEMNGFNCEKADCMQLENLLITRRGGAKTERITMTTALNGIIVEKNGNIRISNILREKHVKENSIFYKGLKALNPQKYSKKRLTVKAPTRFTSLFFSTLRFKESYSPGAYQKKTGLHR